MSEEAVRIDRKPQIKLALSPAGVHVHLEAVLHGDADDWSGDTVGAFLMDLWEAARQTATLHHQFGLHVMGAPEPTVTVSPAAPAITAPEPPLEPPMPARAILQVPAPSLAAAIARAEANGSITRPYTGKSKTQYHAEMAAQQRQVLIYLAGMPDQEATRKQLDRQFPNWQGGMLKERLHSLRADGLLEFRPVPGGKRNFGFWGLTEAGKEAAARPEEGPPHPLAVVLPYTKGKTFLMLGGDATPERVRSIEATLQLQELRWPTFYDEQPISLRLREIEREDVDMVLINRWNRRYSRHYQHHARDCGKPCVMLTRGINAQQIVEQLRQQLPQIAGAANPLALAA